MHAVCDWSLTGYTLQVSFVWCKDALRSNLLIPVCVVSIIKINIQACTSN